MTDDVTRPPSGADGCADSVVPLRMASLPMASAPRFAIVPVDEIYVKVGHVRADHGTDDAEPFRWAAFTPPVLEATTIGYLVAYGHGEAERAVRAGAGAIPAYVLTDGRRVAEDRPSDARSPAGTPAAPAAPRDEDDLGTRTAIVRAAIAAHLADPTVAASKHAEEIARTLEAKAFRIGATAAKRTAATKTLTFAQNVERLVAHAATGATLGRRAAEEAAATTARRTAHPCAAATEGMPRRVADILATAGIVGQVGGRTFALKKGTTSAMRQVEKLVDGLPKDTALAVLRGLSGNPAHGGSSVRSGYIAAMHGVASRFPRESADPSFERWIASVDLEAAYAETKTRCGDDYGRRAPVLRAIMIERFEASKARTDTSATGRSDG